MIMLESENQWSIHSTGFREFKKFHRYFYWQPKWRLLGSIALSGGQAFVF
jgi:hypothetical protein